MKNFLLNCMNSKLRMMFSCREPPEFKQILDLEIFSIQSICTLSVIICTQLLNPKKTGEGLIQPPATLTACHSICGHARCAKLDVYLVYHLMNMRMKKKWEVFLKNCDTRSWFLTVNLHQLGWSSVCNTTKVIVGSLS